jgi:hypothetical protein
MQEFGTPGDASGDCTRGGTPDLPTQDSKVRTAYVPSPMVQRFSAVLSRTGGRIVDHSAGERVSLSKYEI